VPYDDARRQYRKGKTTDSDPQTKHPDDGKEKAMLITTVVSTPTTFRATLGFGCDICHRPRVCAVRSTMLQTMANITCTKQIHAHEVQA